MWWCQHAAGPTWLHMTGHCVPSDMGESLQHRRDLFIGPLAKLFVQGWPCVGDHCKAHACMCRRQLRFRGHPDAVLTPAHLLCSSPRAAAHVQHNKTVLSCREALDAALATQRPEIVHSMLEELASRAGLHAALAGRLPQQLLPLLRHLSRHITDPRHSQVLAGVAARVLDLYATSVHADPEVRLLQRRGRMLRQLVGAGL